MAWYEIFRGFNVLACFFALWYLAIKAFHQWSTWSAKTQSHWWAFFGWVFIGAEGSLESMVLQTTPGPRIVLGTIVIVWTLRTLLIKGEVRFESENIRREFQRLRKEVKHVE